MMPFIEPGKLLMAANLLVNDRWRLADLADPPAPTHRSTPPLPDNEGTAPRPTDTRRDHG